ncbi:CDP-diacylglycerol--glycerol-3-phosphate 3-phosphatidyltransferase 2 [Dorcoceras hygrometricum]|uniref:CDP-diacylglycerol--glycerol-3-phosphate 3-phosphatidyltransferase 2 n=1 Tax=Dorcoceras hygrometricum TaxID=472368 RepID=A0A2Z7BR78_9LAMI|nr:CDP-diacylglycerol--glycerol-3-phosphate 3-phosphatidyltransferase 2 [Dorcoceras hygrometricum]
MRLRSTAKLFSHACWTISEGIAPVSCENVKSDQMLKTRDPDPAMNRRSLFSSEGKCVKQTHFNVKKLVSTGLNFTEAIYSRRIDEYADAEKREKQREDSGKNYRKVKQSTTMEKELIASVDC